jgi:hypothetical protein
MNKFWNILCCHTEYPVVRQLQTWFVFTCILITISIIAVLETIKDCKKYVVDTWHHELSECDTDGPILLSRAFTTLGWARGLAVGLALLSICFIIITPTPHGKKKPNHVYIKKPLSVALLIFSAAFLVNMFESNAHGMLIALGSIFGIIFTIPGCECGPFILCYRESKQVEWLNVCSVSTSVIWWTLWSFMVLNCILFISFMTESCLNGTLSYEQCPSLRSYWYITEYLFFWTLYFLVGFSIAMEEEEEEVKY